MEPKNIDLDAAPTSKTSEIKITFSTPHKAVAPGQIAVVYDENGQWCLGCGVIEDTDTMDLPE